MNASRQKILQRLRAAQPLAAQAFAAAQDAALFADYPASSAQRAEHFAAKFVSLKGEFYRAQNFMEAAAQLKELLQPLAQNPQNGAFCARHAHGLLDQIFQADSWLQQVCVCESHEITNIDFAKFEAGITAADFLVARTGSIILQAQSAGGRRLSVLPPLHIVVAQREQLVNSLEDAFAALSAQNEKFDASYLAVITGPSRTSDIEKTLVLGAHGPKRLAIILIG